MATDLYSSSRQIALALAKSPLELSDYVLGGTGSEKGPDMKRVAANLSSGSQYAPQYSCRNQHIYTRRHTASISLLSPAKKQNEGFCCGGVSLRCQVSPALLRLSPNGSGRDACFFLFYFQAPCLRFSLSLLQYIIPLGVCSVSLSYRMRDPTAHGVKSLPCPTHTNKTINNSASSGSII